MGVGSVHGFLPCDATAEAMLLGNVFLVRVDQISSEGRVIKVSTSLEQDPVDGEVAGVTLNQLMPGCVLTAQPEKTLAKGVVVSLGNGMPFDYATDDSRCERFCGPSCTTTTTASRSIQVDAFSPCGCNGLPAELLTSHPKRSSGHCRVKLSAAPHGLRGRFSVIYKS